jgi:hypothetical protein
MVPAAIHIRTALKLSKGKTCKFHEYCNTQELQDFCRFVQRSSDMATPCERSGESVNPVWSKGEARAVSGEI